MVDKIKTSYADCSEESEMANLIKAIAEGEFEQRRNDSVEDDVFMMCSGCKDAFLRDVYSHISRSLCPDIGRAHLIN
jgi:hypothetical protein